MQGLKDPAETVVSNGAFEPVTMTGDSHKGTSSTGQLVFEMLDPRGGGGSDRGNGSQSAATGRFGYFRTFHAGRAHEASKEAR